MNLYLFQADVLGKLEDVNEEKKLDYDIVGKQRRDIMTLKVRIQIINIIYRCHAIIANVHNIRHFISIYSLKKY